MKAVKSIVADTERQIVLADKGDRTLVTSYGLGASECKEDDTAVINYEKQFNSALSKLH